MKKIKHHCINHPDRGSWILTPKGELCKECYLREQGLTDDEIDLQTGRRKPYKIGRIKR